MTVQAMRPKAHQERTASPRRRAAAPSHWALRLAAGLLLGGALSSTSTAMSTPLAVSARIQDQGNQLRLEWTVKNTGDTPVWVMRQPAALQDQPPGTPALYVEPGQAGTLDFSLKAFALPEGVMASTFEYIHLQTLPPGAQWQASEKIALPLQAHVPYASFNARALPADARKARLCIGFLTQAPGNLSPMFKQADGTLRLPHEPGLVKAQKLACSPVVTW